MLRYRYEGFKIYLLIKFFICSDWSATVEFTDAINGTTYVYRELYSQSLNKVNIFNFTQKMPSHFLIDDPAHQCRPVHVKKAHMSCHVMSLVLYLNHAVAVRLWCIICLPVQVDAKKVKLWDNRTHNNRAGNNPVVVKDITPGCNLFLSSSFFDFSEEILLLHKRLIISQANHTVACTLKLHY